ncbi:MAG: alanine racemase [Elusimicrobia bacterium]|nr:alanine racemase [Elusimicrobiota bacterium]
MQILRPTYAEINLGALRNNFSKIRNMTGAAVMPVVKADAYGHGAVRVADVLEKSGADMLGVATVEEGIDLRENSIKIPILVLGSIYPFGNFEKVIEYGLVPIIASRMAGKMLSEAAERAGKKVAFHLKVDTGMGRIGVAPETAAQLGRELENSPFLQMDGIFTHLACADENAAYTSEQLRKFKWVLDKLPAPPPYIHAANTAGLVKSSDCHFTLVRPGLAVYGLYPGERKPADFGFEPVLSWKSKVVFIKEIEKGSSVSYGCTWRAPARSRIATVCVGYADGYSRMLSNRARVLIRGGSFPVVGRVCMDMIMVDVTENRDITVGDDVTLIGKDGGAGITAEKLAEWASTINYEIVTGISRRVPRVFRDDQA